jgi:predicted tellurium resistance membrane protein TerC
VESPVDFRAGRALTPGRRLAFLRGMDFLADPQIWISLLTLTGLEIVLGIDNVIFISILAGKLPRAQQAKARQTGLALALFTRIGLLCSIAWLARLTDPLFAVLGHTVAGRDLILLAGGLFLIGKSTFEIHDKLEGAEGAHASGKAARFGAVVVQIMLLDIVFSLDSVITAVGMAQHLWVMITAVVLAMGVMLFFAGTISDFVHRHPTLKMLALSFLILIGVALVAEGMHQAIPKGYIYFSMAFAFGVEMLNLRLRAKTTVPPVELHQSIR